MTGKLTNPKGSGGNPSESSRAIKTLCFAGYVVNTDAVNFYMVLHIDLYVRKTLFCSATAVEITGISYQLFSNHPCAMTANEASS